MSQEQQLEGLHEALAMTLKVSVDSVKQALSRGEVPSGAAALLNVARQFLKDNGIEGIPTEENPLGKLTESMPFDAEEQIH